MILFAVPSKRICKKLKFSYRFMSLSSSLVVESLDIPEENIPHCPDYTDLRKKMQSLANCGSISKALEVFGAMGNVPGKPTVYDYNSLINWYLKSKSVRLDDLLGLYFEMKRLGLYPNAITFNTLLKGLNLLGESKPALSIITEMCSYGFTPSFSCLSNLFKKSLDSMDLVDAVSFLEFMLSLNYIPTEPKVILLINSLSRYGMIRDAYFVFVKLSDTGSFQNPYIHNPILWALCKTNQISAGLAFFCYLKKKGFVHNVCSYTALVYGFSKKGFFKEASHVLRVMETDGFTPNVKTYTTIIKFLCDDGRITEALCLLRIMEEQGSDLDIVTCNVILRALCQENMLVEICDLFQTIDQKGLSPERYTATALSGLLKRGNIQIAHNLLRHIMLKESNMDVPVYNVYISCLCYACESEKAFSLISFMKKDGIEPNYTTYNTVLSAACKVGDSVMVWRVLDGMEYEGFKLDIVGLTCLMRYFYKVGNIHDCLKLFEHMICHGPRPSIATINTLMVGLCKNRELGAAYRVFSNLKSYGLSPDSTTYNILIRAARNQRNNIVLKEVQRKCKPS